MSEVDPKASLPFHIGAITALACWLAATLAFALHLDNPWWAAISAWVVANPERHALLAKASNRILGTIIGCLASYWVTLWVENRPVLQLLAMFGFAAIGVYGRFRSAQSYAWIIGAVGALAILAMSLETPGQIFHFAVFRACEVICGVIAVTFMESLLYRKNSPVDSKITPAKPADKVMAPTMDRATALRLAVIGGVAVILIPILWSWLNLPSLSQIVVSCLVVLDRDGASTHFRGLQRILGCVAGGAVGLLTIRLGPDSFFIWSIMLVAGIFLFSLIPTVVLDGLTSVLREESPSSWPWSPGSVRPIRFCRPSTGSPGCSAASGFYSASALYLVSRVKLPLRGHRRAFSTEGSKEGKDKED